jgi:hypothetical protein
VEGDRRKIECGNVGAVRDNVPIVIKKKKA